MKGASRIDDAYDSAQYAKNLYRINNASQVAVIGKKMNRVDDAADLYKAVSYVG